MKPSQTFVTRIIYSKLMLPSSVEVRFPSSEFARDERILWSGRPDPLTAALSQWPTLIFAVIWTSIAMSSAFEALQRGVTLGTLISLSFIGAGVWMLGYPVLIFVQAKRTCFAITDRRLIISGRDGKRLTSIQLNRVGQVEKIVRRGKTTLRIPTAIVSDGDGGKKIDYADLHGLEDGDRAYRLLTQQPV